MLKKDQEGLFDPPPNCCRVNNKFLIKNGKYSSKYIYFYDSNGHIYLKVHKNYYENLSI